MINKKNYWLFSIVLLAAAESTYEADGCKTCKELCCSLCDKKNKKDSEKSKFVFHDGIEIFKFGNIN
ncbi:MAG: hypothetical protein II393_02710 [Cytophagales bacterium]|nr:hypothetical protein [Cytophagales bacterium]